VGKTKERHIEVDGLVHTHSLSASTHQTAQVDCKQWLEVPIPGKETRKTPDQDRLRPPPPDRALCGCYWETRWAWSKAMR